MIRNGAGSPKRKPGRRLRVKRGDPLLSQRLLTIHNLHYYQALVRGLREAIEAGYAAGLVMHAPTDDDLESVFRYLVTR